MNLKDVKAIITGAGRGLGRATAEALAQRGARVVLVARTGSEVEEVAAALRSRGHHAFAIAADIGDKQSIYLLAGRAAERVGPVNVLIHNASTLGPTPLPYLLDTPCEDFARVLEVNLVGPFRLTKALAGNMVVRGQGLVIHLSSDAAVNAYPRWGTYGVSKAALDHLSRSLAVELEKTGVKVWSVDPGEMDTRMHRDAIPDADPTTLARPEAVAARLVSLIEHGEKLESGARVALQGWQAP